MYKTSILILLICILMRPVFAQSNTETSSKTILTAKATTVFESDFTEDVSEAWSLKKRQSWAEGKYWTLGPFIHEKLQLKLQDLPEHEAIEVRFDLVILGGWTGNRIISQAGQMCGPNFFSLQADQSLNLIFTTFSNIEFDRQSFPGPYRSEYVRAKGRWVNTKLMDAFQGGNVYQLTQQFWHQGNSLTLDFQAMGLGLDKKRQWALMNIEVKALTEVKVPRLEEEKLTELLKQLALENPHQVALAQARLAMMHPDNLQQWKAQMNEQLLEGPDVSGLIDQLGAGDLETRQQAMKALQAMGPGVAPMLNQALESAESLEQRDALMLLLTQVAGQVQFQAKDREALNLLLRINRPESKALAKEFRRAFLGGLGVLGSKTRWEGLCYQEGRRPYRMVLRVDEINQDQSVRGEMHWPELRDSKTRFKGKLQGQRLLLTEYELFQGSHIVIPVNYELQLVGQRIHGFWHDPNNKTQWGYVQLRPVVYRE